MLVLKSAQGLPGCHRMLSVKYTCSASFLHNVVVSRKGFKVDAHTTENTLRQGQMKSLNLSLIVCMQLTDHVAVHEFREAMKYCRRQRTRKRR